MESLEAFESNIEITGEMVRVRNEAQAAMIITTLRNGEDMNLHAMQWIKENALEFEEVFDQYLKEDPTIVERWDDDGQEILSVLTNRMQERRLDVAA